VIQNVYRYSFTQAILSPATPPGVHHEGGGLHTRAGQQAVRAAKGARVGSWQTQTRAQLRHTSCKSDS